MTGEWESNDARNTREFYEHRQLVLERIRAAIAAEKQRKRS